MAGRLPSRAMRCRRRDAGLSAPVDGPPTTESGLTGRPSRCAILRAARRRDGYGDPQVPEVTGMVVLVPLMVQRTRTAILACRWNCKAGKCGSCSGGGQRAPRPMCKTRIDTLPRGPVTVLPMIFPADQGPVTDVSRKYENQQADPALHAAPTRHPRGGSGRWTSTALYEHRGCIECSSAGRLHVTAAMT